MRRALVATLVPAVAGLMSAACTSKGGTAVKVSATETQCEPATSTIAAGKVTFTVKNDGKQITEMYVMQGTKTIGEVENIGAGTSRTLSADLKAGTYELVCKPGMKGDGIKEPITVTGSGGGESKAADQKVDINAFEYAFTGLEQFAPKAGERVTFELKNPSTNKEEHEFEVFGPDGKAIGEVSEVKPGGEGETTLTLDKPGTYTYECGVDDHKAKGMRGTFTVS
jgi:iron uptake system component EfeO